MTIKATCPDCGESFQIKRSDLGKTATCSCGTKYPLLVPNVPVSAFQPSPSMSPFERRHVGRKGKKISGWLWVAVGVVGIMMVINWSDARYDARHKNDKKTVWVAIKDVIAADNSDDLDRSPTLFPGRFSKIKEGTEVLAYPAGGFERAIIKVTQDGQEFCYLYNDEFGRAFVTK